MPVENLDLFSYKIGKDTKVMIYYDDRLLLTYSKKKAASFLKKIRGIDYKDQQMIMAKLTGNFKRGNERNAKNTDKNQEGRKL